MNFPDEKKKFIYEIFSKFGTEWDINKNWIGNGYIGSVWRISDELCLKISKNTCYHEIPDSFKKCENLCVPLKTFVSKSGKYIGIVQKYLNLYSLENIIKNKILLSEKQVANILGDILNGVKVIHESGYVHRDLYPGNIMLTLVEEEHQAVIIDFDEMQLMTEATRACFQYNGYQAPEIVLENGIYDEKSEIFNIGVIFWELILGKCPFGGYDYFGRVIECSWDNYIQNKEFYNERVKQAIQNLRDYLRKIEGCSNECKNLLCSLLCFEKENRLTAREALNHSFFGSKT